jgi:hypothetical protein
VGGVDAAADLLAQIRSGAADRALRLVGARGVLPLAPDDALRALLSLSVDPEDEIATTARTTLAAMPPDAIVQFVIGGRPTPEELDLVAHNTDDAIVLENVIRHRDTPNETLLALAGRVTGSAQEALVINQVRLLRFPLLVDALQENPELTADSRRRIGELREEFFDKQRRRQEADAIEEGPAEPGEDGEVSERKKDDLLSSGFSEQRREIEDTGSKTLGATFRRLTYMTVSEKIQRALKGDREERRILIGDANKLVAESVLKSPILTEAEVEGFATMRHITDELLRAIAGNRAWTRRYPIVIALVHNPKVPLDVSVALLSRLHIRDLKGVGDDRNLPETLRIQARKLYRAKRGG